MINLFLFLLLLPSPPKHYKPKVLGNTGSMVRQNQEIDCLNLPRIVNDKQLHQLISQGELVRITENETTILMPVSEDRKYVRPWVRDFIRDMAAGFFSNFNKPLVIDSAVRTVEQQAVLIRTNRYAASPYGMLPSSHLAGTTIDIAKRRYSSKERKWIVSYLKSMKDKGLVEAVEEPFCYHVLVYEVYNEINITTSFANAANW